MNTCRRSGPFSSLLGVPVFAAAVAHLFQKNFLLKKSGSSPCQKHFILKQTLVLAAQCGRYLFSQNRWWCLHTPPLRGATQTNLLKFLMKQGLIPKVRLAGSDSGGGDPPQHFHRLLEKWGFNPKIFSAFCLLSFQDSGAMMMVLWEM